MKRPDNGSFVWTYHRDEERRLTLHLLLAAAFLTLILWASWLNGRGASTNLHPQRSTTTVQCQEDEPCWDCHTMGNRICGPNSG